MRLVRGVGVNDAGYPVTIRGVVDGSDKIIWRCPVYRIWADMLNRSYNHKRHQINPTYSDCYVVNDWLSFSIFRRWVLGQDWKGKQLDKDILTKGNKVYGPDTCVFVPAKLNTFMLDCGDSRGEHPTGVHLERDSGRFKAQCCNPFTRKKENLGRFRCPQAASEAWRARKHELACTYADMQTDPRIAAALRSRYAPTGECK